MTRAAICLLTLAGAAFAPAPFPRTESRGGDRLWLEAIQGEWEAMSIHEMDEGKLRRIDWGVRRVYVRKDRWGFDEEGGGYYVKLDGSRRPPAIDLRHSPGPGSDPAITGVLRWHQGNLQMLYVFTKEGRPTRFDRMRQGDRLMTLRPVRR